jgi:hypothetical protein
MYWNGLLPGKPIPLPAHMTMMGKRELQSATKEES